MGRLWRPSALPSHELLGPAPATDPASCIDCDGSWVVASAEGEELVCPSCSAAATCRVLREVRLGLPGILQGASDEARRLVLDSPSLAQVVAPSAADRRVGRFGALTVAVRRWALYLPFRLRRGFESLLAAVASAQIHEGGLLDFDASLGFPGEGPPVRIMFDPLLPRPLLNELRDCLRVALRVRQPDGVTVRRTALLSEAPGPGPEIRSRRLDAEPDLRLPENAARLRALRARLHPGLARGARRAIADFDSTLGYPGEGPSSERAASDAPSSQWERFMDGVLPHPQ